MRNLRTMLCIGLILLCAATTNAKIVFSTWANGKSQIFVMNDNGRNITQINDTPHSEWMPRWSHNGRQIAFLRDITPDDGSGTPDIYIMNANGSNDKQLLDHKGTIRDIRISPNGKELLYITAYIGINILDIDTRETKKILINHGYHCDWSPDGKQVVYINDDHGVIEKNLWIADANGENHRQFTHPDPEKGEVFRFHPRWSPDGKQMLYTELDIIVNKEGIRTAGANRYVIQNIDDGNTRTLKIPENWSPNSVEWMNEQRSVLFSAYVYDKENDLADVSKIYKYDLVTDEITFLTEGSRAHWNDGALPITPEGKQSVRWAELKRTYTK